jgi:hypothetical protein
MLRYGEDRDVLVKTFHAACHGLVNNIQTMPIEKI